MSVRIELATDGSGTTRGPGGWAFVLQALDTETGQVIKRVEGCGCMAQTTNQRAEMTALLQGLRAVTRPSEILVITDSEYVMNAFAKGWLESWQRKDWRKATKGKDAPEGARQCPTCAAIYTGDDDLCRRHDPYSSPSVIIEPKAVSNRDLWEALIEAATPHRLRWHWVKGHTGHPLNEVCDELAGQGRRFVMKHLEEGTLTPEDFPHVEGPTRRAAEVIF